MLWFWSVRANCPREMPDGVGQPCDRRGHFRRLVVTAGPIVLLGQRQIPSGQCVKHLGVSTHACVPAFLREPLLCDQQLPRCALGVEGARIYRRGGGGRRCGGGRGRGRRGGGGGGRRRGGRSGSLWPPPLLWRRGMLAR